MAIATSRSAGVKYGKKVSTSDARKGITLADKKSTATSPKVTPPPSTPKGAGTPSKKKSTVPVLTSSAAEKDLNENIRPAFEEAKAGIDEQKSLMEQQQAIANEQKAAQETSALDNATKQAKLDEIKNKALLIKKELDSMGEEDLEDTKKDQAYKNMRMRQQGIDPDTQGAEPVSELGATQNELAKVSEAYWKEANRVSKQILDIQNGVVPFTAGERAQIKGLEQEFRLLMDEQRLINKGATGTASVRGYQTGAAEYDPQFTARTIGAIASAGVQKIATLNTKMASAVAELEQSFKDNKISAVKDAYSIYKEAAKERQDTLRSTIDDIQAEMKAARDALAKSQEEVNKIIANAAKGGAPVEVIAMMSEAGSVPAAIAIAGDYLQEGSGVVGEYIFYKRQAENAGQVPMDFNSYADMDANRKRSIVNVNAGGLSSTESSTYNRFTDKYQADPIIMAAEKGRTAKTIAQQVLADPENAGNQLKSLYVLVKNLDPDSAVREGEVTLAQMTQSYSQQFNNALTRISKGQVISPDTATLLANSTLELADAWEKSAVRRTNRYISQANNSSPNVGTAFGNYLAEYEELNMADEAIQNDVNDPLRLGGQSTVNNPLGI